MKIAILTWIIWLPLITYAQTNNTVQAQKGNITISGVVIDAQTKEPLPGATVHIKGTTHEGLTNERGEFKFVTGQRLPVIFQVTYIGYKPQEDTVNQATGIVLSLQTSNVQLGDVVVVGYGTRQRKNLINAVSQVQTDAIKDIPVASVDAQLQGQAAGVQINSNTGVPGEGVFIRVRGTTSINASNDPLYVVDGVFINNTSLQTVNTGGRASSPIADINPSDIEHIEVLKDASATAIYGARGANGVVIITTKRGKFTQKPTINFNTSHGWAWAPKLWDLTTGPEHATLINEFYRNSEQDAIAANDQAGIQKYAKEPFRPVDDGGRGLPEEQSTYDRLHELFRTGALHNYNLSLQGGTQNNKYYIGAGYTQQEADIRPVGFNRASLKLNLDQRVNDKIIVGTSNSIYRSYRNQARAGDGPQGGLLQSALHTPTYLPEVNADGTPARWAGFDNLQVLINNYDVHTTSLRYIGNLYAEAEILPDLKFRTSWSLDYNNYDESEYWNDLTQLGAAPTNGLATSSIAQSSTWINEQTLSYRKHFNSQHTLGVLVGNTLQSNVQKSTFAQGSGFPNNSYKLISAAATRTSSQAWTKANLASFFSRLDYNYASKYFVEFSIRADGSSRFGANHQFGYFPAVGIGWRIKDEPFLKNTAWLSDLKLRASYGITGNQNGIGDFAARGTWYGGAGYPDNTTGGDLPGTAPQQLANPDLKWEKTSQTNFGIDFSALDDRISVELNLYSKYTTDALLQLPVPAITGVPVVSSTGETGGNTYFANAGEVSNKGYEVAINTVNIRTKNFTWQTGFNIAGNRNRIKKLATPITYYNRDWIRLQEGSSMFSFWLYKQLYVDPQTGEAVFEDLNKDGQITVADRQVLGNAVPDFFGGITNNFSFRSFDLGITFTYQYGNDIFNLNRFFGEGGGTRDANRVLFASQLNRWQKPGDITDVPRLTAYGNNYTLQQNSRFLEDGSFLKLSSLTLGYTLPENISLKAGIKKVRVYFIGTNLLLLTHYTGPDPEVNVTAQQNVQGLDLGTPPQPRTVQFGVNVTL